MNKPGQPSRVANRPTEIVVVLDSSGSMGTIVADTKRGFDQFVREQQAVEGECNLTLVKFANGYEFVHSGLPIQAVPPLEFSPNGGTALLDAVGRAILETDERLNADPARNVIFVVITDGEENSSSEFRLEHIRALIKERSSWSFVFFGADIDAMAESAKLGIGVASTLSFSKSRAHVAASYATLSKNISDVRANEKQDMSFTKRQRAKMAKRLRARRNN